MSTKSLFLFVINYYQRLAIILTHLYSSEPDNELALSRLIGRSVVICGGSGLLDVCRLI